MSKHGRVRMGDTQAHWARAEGEECPLCMSKLQSFAALGANGGSVAGDAAAASIFVCCGYRICAPCYEKFRASKVGNRCPQCRHMVPLTDAKFIRLLECSVDALKAWAMAVMATWLQRGLFGLQVGRDLLLNGSTVLPRCGKVGDMC